MYRHQHTGREAKSDSYDFGMRKTHIMFKEWLAYHVVRDKPITSVGLNLNEKKRQNTTFYDMMSNVHTWLSCSKDHH
jgi:hypothetical protein